MIEILSVSTKVGLSLRCSKKGSLLCFGFMVYFNGYTNSIHVDAISFLVFTTFTTIRSPKTFILLNDVSLIS